MKVLLLVIVLVDIIGTIHSYGLSSMALSHKRFTQSIILSRSSSSPSSSLFSATSSSAAASSSISKNNKNPINIIKRILASIYSAATNTINYIITFLALLLPGIKRKTKTSSDSNDDVESIDSVIAMAKLDTVNAKVNSKVEAKQDELISVTILTSDDIPEIPTSISSSTSLSATATEQNKKWVENKLKELKEQTDKVPIISPVVSSSNTQSNESESSISSAAASSSITSSSSTSPSSSSSSSTSSTSSSSTSTPPSSEVESESAVSLKDKIKAFGISGTISYILTELAFWAISIPVIIYSYHSESGQWLDFSVEVDRAKILGLSAAFLTAARLAVPLRLGVALSFTPFVEENITNVYFKNNDDNKEKNSVL